MLKVYILAITGGGPEGGLLEGLTRPGGGWLLEAGVEDIDRAGGTTTIGLLKADSAGIEDDEETEALTAAVEGFCNYSTVKTHHTQPDHRVVMGDTCE
jgi:hypothetical protein